MKKVSNHLLFLILVSLFMTGCSGHGVSQQEYDSAVAAKDSLAAVNDSTAAELNELTNYLAMLSESVDSITKEQNIIVNSIDPETGRKFNRSELRSRILNFADLIRRQRARIQELSDSLKSGMSENAKIGELTTLIDFLNAQLMAKEAEVDNLRSQLAAGKKNIEELNAGILSLTETNSKLTAENETLDREIAAQTDRLNEGYVLVKTKKELEQMGLLKGGFLKKSTFQAGNVDISMCRKVDIRHFNDIVLNSKKPKLLSQAPKDSYSFEPAGGNKTRLVILDTIAFWSLSNVVIIQL